MRVLMDCDIYNGGKYNNFGIHGTGISTAADSLAAIKKYVFEEKSIGKADLIRAIDENFENTPELLHKLRFEAPKLGNNDDFVDSIATELLDAFSDALKGKTNCRGGIYRAGTGSAMEYYSSSKDVGATADGRKKGEPYGCSFSPAITCNCEGPLSCIQSFTKFDLTKIINGGPLTLEIHDTVFSNNQGIKKVAQLVKAFIHLGGHQLQLNSVNRDRLLDAEAHPENHKNLIVRVWGWSGHFTELDKPYRDHIIKRTEFKV